MIMMHMRHTIQLASVDNRLLIYSIRACHIQSNGIEGSKHSHIGYNGNIIFRMAVTVRGNIHHQADMEMRTAGNHSLAVFGNFAVQDIIAFIPGSAYRIFGTHTDTTSAAHTFLVINGRFSIGNGRRVMGADFNTASAADTVLLLHIGLSCIVHFHLTGTGTAAHTDVFQRSAETGGFMALEMAECDENIRIHNSASYFRLFYIFAAFYRYQLFIRTL